MSQAAFSLPHFSPIELLSADYEVAITEKTTAYAIADKAAPAAYDVAEAGCSAAYDAAESVADMILAIPAGSLKDLAIKARVLLTHGADPADLLHYRPDDLSRFVEEVRSLART